MIAAAFYLIFPRPPATSASNAFLIEFSQFAVDYFVGQDDTERKSFEKSAQRRFEQFMLRLDFNRFVLLISHSKRLTVTRSAPLGWLG